MASSSLIDARCVQEAAAIFRSRVVVVDRDESRAAAGPGSLWAGFFQQEEEIRVDAAPQRIAAVTVGDSPQVR